MAILVLVVLLAVVLGGYFAVRRRQMPKHS